MATEYLTTDIDLKKVADGIRSRTGKTAPLAFPDGYVTEIGTLTNTSDATVTEGDMSYGVVAYGKDGQVYGGVPTIDGNSEKALGDSTVGFHGGLGKIQLAHRIPRLGMLFREGSTVILRASPSDFGNATAADVAKGKTFTAAAGLNVVGTAGGAEPVVIYLPQNGLSDLKSYTLTHNLGRKPVAIYCMRGARSNNSKSIQWFNAVLDPKTTSLILYYATSSVFGRRGQANVSEFPSSGFVGEPYYIQIGNANENTIDFKFGETSSYSAELTSVAIIVY